MAREDMLMCTRSRFVPRLSPYVRLLAFSRDEWAIAVSTVKLAQLEAYMPDTYPLYPDLDQIHCISSYPEEPSCI